MVSAAKLECAKCLKSFRSDQLLKTHKRMNSCRRKTFEDMEKENENLAAAIVIEDDDIEESITLNENSALSLKELKKQSMAMVDQVETFLSIEDQPSELTLSEENFNELSNKLSSSKGTLDQPYQTLAKPYPASLRPTAPPPSHFKRPQVPPLPMQKTIAKKKSVVDSLTGKACIYCNLEVPDSTSLAFHYVRQHWQVVREKHSKQWEGSGGRPKSKFHLPGTTNMQDEVIKMQMPTKPTARPTARTYQRAGGSFLPKAGPYRPYHKGADASWLRKLEEKKIAQLSYQERMQRYKEMSKASKTNRRILPIQQNMLPVAKANPNHFNQQNITMHQSKQQQNMEQMVKSISDCEVCDDDFFWPDSDHSCPRTQKNKLASKSVATAPSKSPQVNDTVQAAPSKVTEMIAIDPIPANDPILVVD